MPSESLAQRKNPSGERSIAVIYLLIVSVAMLGWIYAIARGALALGTWLFG
jgi:hypothetical protein